LFGGGFLEIGFILFIAYLLFGPKKVPEIARTLGKGLGELRRASNELKNSLEEEIRNLDHLPESGSEGKGLGVLRRASNELKNSLEEEIKNFDRLPESGSDKTSIYGHHDPEPTPKEPGPRP
jgi:TatA/E family protein of Tat protein translocase